MKTLRNLTLAALSMAASSHAATYTMDDAFKVGVFVENSFKITGGGSGGESEGTMVIGGNFTTGSAAYNVKVRTEAYVLPSGVVLAVGGTIDGSAKINPSGSVVVKDDDESDIDFAALSTVRPDLPRTPINESVDVSQAFTDLRSLSTAIANAAAGGAGTADDAPSATLSGGALVLPDPVAYTLPYLGNVFIYNVDAALFDGASSNSIPVTRPWTQDDKIVFNIVGTLTDNLFNYHLDGNAVGIGSTTTFDNASNPWADNIIWNISNGLDIQADVSFIGTLLAPNSTLYKTNITVEGAFMVQDVEVTGAGEFHPITSETPEPTSALGALLLAAGLMRRQRR